MGIKVVTFGMSPKGSPDGKSKKKKKKGKKKSESWQEETMVDFAKPLLQTTVGLGALALVGSAAGTAKTMWDPKKKQTPKKQTKTLLKGFVGVMVGTGLLKGIATQVNQF